MQLGDLNVEPISSDPGYKLQQKTLGELLVRARLCCKVGM